MQHEPTKIKIDTQPPPSSITPSPVDSSAPILVPHGSRPACFKNTFQEILFVFTATIAIGITSMSTGTVTVITSFVGRELEMSTPEITWINASSSLASGSFLLTFARIADLFGRRTLFIGSLFFFAIFALAAGFSRTPLTLDILSGLMGLMSAAAVPPAQGILSLVYDKPSKRKNAAFACFSAGNPLGFVFGMICSGIANQLFGWRASFWWLSIIYGCFAVVAFFIVPQDTGEKEKLEWDVLKRFDIFGTVLTIAGIGMFSAALSLGSDAPNGWRTGYVLALLVLGIICMVAFVFWELHFDHPLIPMRIFKDRNFSLLLAIILLGFISFTTASFWISLYIQRVWNASALKTAVFMLPMAIGGIAVNIVAALILHKVSNKLLMGIGAVSYTLAFLFYALNRTSYPYWAMLFPGMLLAVVGADFQFNVTNMYVMSSLSKSQQSIASGMCQTVEKLCITIGMGISTAIFDGMSKTPPEGFHAGDPVQPYSGTFWFSVACAGSSVFLVPWLTIGTQGHAGSDSTVDEKVIESEEVVVDGTGKV